ncbi:MAG: multicopper oxidase domain-containing protein [Marinibacterium sp.]
MITRRHLLGGLGAGMLAAALPARGWTGPVRPLAMPPLLDATGTGRFSLTAQAGKTAFLGQASSDTWGFNQPYLGPTLRLPAKGVVQAEVRNTLNTDISVHWHGLIIPGDVDGGPHQPIAPGATWSPDLPVEQRPATLWYHSHIHGQTAPQVHKGLAGVLQLSDGLDDDRGLPSAYGVDDLTLVLQDRRFDRRGRMEYSLSMPERMMGFLGDTMVINGQVGTTAALPRGIVRLRLLNASNSRIYDLALSDGRPMSLIGTDNGLLDRPVEMTSLTLAPAERYEVLVDFSDGGAPSLLSRSVRNMGMMGGRMGGMMGGGRMGGGAASGPPFKVLAFAVDDSLPARITAMPQDLGGSRASVDPTGAKRRDITLDMGMGPGMMMRAADRRFSINGRPFDMRRTDFTIPQGSVEHWSVSANMMMHPFHVHGVTFQVLAENGQKPKAQNAGWKDTVLINGQADLLMKFDRPAAADLPFMFHCHILEHEDGGMMGQFAVV